MILPVKRSKVELFRGRVNWGDPVNLICSMLSERGMHGQTITRAIHLTVPQVYARCRKLGIGLRDYRNGRGRLAKSIVAKYSITTITQPTLKKVMSDALRPKK